MSKILTSKQYLSQLNLIYFAQAAMMLIFAAIVFALNYFGKITGSQDEATASLFNYILLAVVVIGFSSAHFLYGYLVSKIDQSLPLQKKMPKFTGAVILRGALLELPGMFASIVFFLNGNIFLLLIPVATGVVFFLLRPTATSITADLNLSSEDKALINNPDAIIAEIDTPRKK